VIRKKKSNTIIRLHVTKAYSYSSHSPLTEYDIPPNGHYRDGWFFFAKC